MSIIWEGMKAQPTFSLPSLALRKLLHYGRSLRSQIGGRKRNRSGCENRNHATACDFCTLAGSRDGAASPRRAASHAVVRDSKTLRCCCFRVATTVIMLSTQHEPSALCVPKLPLRQSTPGRIDLSAVLLVGSTPATCTNVHNAWRRFRISRHVPAVLGTPQRLPASNNRSTSRRSGVM